MKEQKQKYAKSYSGSTGPPLHRVLFILSGLLSNFEITPFFTGIFVLNAIMIYPQLSSGGNNLLFFLIFASFSALFFL